MGNDKGGDFVKGGSCGREAWEREAERLALTTGEGVVRSMRGSGLRRESPLRGRERCLPEARERSARGIALTRAGEVTARSPACLATTFAFFKSVLPLAGKAGYREIHPCRGNVVRSRRGSGVQGESPLQRVGVVLARSPACLATTFAFFKSVLPPAGKAGAAWGCRPTEHPLPTPAGNPAGLSGRPLLAWFGRLLGRADAHHTCSQRPLRRNDLRATPRAPQGSATPRGFRR